MAALAPHTGHAQVVGITGAPGVGKSTSTNALVRGAARGRPDASGVLAIDPSSPFSGGALLGDRIRMGDHADDPGVYIRSMAARGHLGGLSWSTPQAMRVLDAAGFDVVLVETVGVGQSEVEVAGLADTTIVLLAPGMGDGIQAAKAGILEVGDLYVVNKADRDGADQVARDLRVDARPGRPPRGRLAARRSSRPPRRPATASPRWSPRSTSTAPGRRRPASCAVAASAAPAPRSRRSPSPRCARAGRRSASTTSSTRWRPRWSRGSPTRTPPPTGCCRRS